MRRSGRVAAMNLQRGMVAIATEDGDYTIIELTTDWELDIGDEVTWPDGYALGFETYQNLTRQTRCEVIVQSHDVSRSFLEQQLLR